MRVVLALMLALSVADCTGDKYTDTPKPTGPWSQANADPDTQDNNIVPLTDLEDGR